MRCFIIYGCIAGMLAMGAVSANALDEKKFEVTVDRSRLAIGEGTQLSLTFFGTQHMPAPDIGNIDGFEVRYVGPSTMVTVINGKMSSSISHLYTIVPLRVGKFQLGPFSFNYDGIKYTSNTATVEVGEDRISPATPTSPVNAPDQPATGQMPDNIALGDRMFITLNTDAMSAYVNELIPVTVKLYVNRLNVSDIQLPTFEQEGFSKVEFKEPKQYREEHNGILYDVLEFKTNIFGTRPGDYRLGPAKIKCSLIVRKRMRNRPTNLDEFDDDFFNSPYQDFFSRAERYPLELKSETVPLIISPLPSAGKPASFLGAVGDYQFIFSATPRALKTGDPLTVKLEINGRGNFNTVLAPALENAEGFKVYEPQIKTEPNRKTFTYVMIPEAATITQTPRATFSFFDPTERRYKSIVQGPLPITVEQSKEEPAAQVITPLPRAATERDGSAGENLARDIVYIKESPGRLYRKGYTLYGNRLVGAVLAVSALVFLVVGIAVARRAKLSRDVAYARRVWAMPRAARSVRHLRSRLRAHDAGGFYATLFMAVQEYLGNRFNIPAAGITGDAIHTLLAPYDIDGNILRKLDGIFTACDQVKFAYGSADELRMKDHLKEFEEIVHYLERM